MYLGVNLPGPFSVGFRVNPSGVRCRAGGVRHGNAAIASRCQDCRAIEAAREDRRLAWAAWAERQADFRRRVDDGRYLLELWEREEARRERRIAERQRREALLATRVGRRQARRRRMEGWTLAVGATAFVLATAICAYLGV